MTLQTIGWILVLAQFLLGLALFARHLWLDWYAKRRQAKQAAYIAQRIKEGIEAMGFRVDRMEVFNASTATRIQRHTPKPDDIEEILRQIERQA